MTIIAINEQGTTVRAEGEMLLVVREGHTIKKLRLAEVDQLLLFGRVELSSGAVALLARRQVDVVFLTLRGSYRARLVTRGSKNVVLRLTQMRRAGEGEFALRVARAIVVGKVGHQRQILLRAQRRLCSEDIAEAVGQMRWLIQRAEREPDLDALRGLEGQAAAIYFRHFGRLIRSEEFSFSRRTRRPPRDPVNAGLSFGYALLTSLTETEVLQCGLDPMVGFFHQPAYGRPSLVLDIIEEFRPLVDGLVLSLLNRRQLGPRDFQELSGASLEALLATPADEPARPGLAGPENLAEEADDLAADADEEGERPSSEDGDRNRPAVYLADSGRRIFLNAFFRRMRERVQYGPREQSLELRQIVREQVYHLARVVQDKDDEYRPFVPR
ncbi:MAG: CRISPR-associated endonuclease Cas1 [Rhodopirellula sp.]|nr:CRISPR-associated endonuclease Cas1 [Rhodopirellula sp.]